MKQQVNLYQAGLKVSNPPLHARMLLQIVVASIFLLVFVSCFMAWKQDSLLKKYQELLNKQQNLTTELEKFRASHPPAKNNPLLDQQLTKLRSKLEGRRVLLGYLATVDYELSEGFFAVIEGLAKSPFKGVWLTGIKINKVDHQILLTGSATRADLIPAYLQHLRRKKIFAGRTFARLQLKRLEERARQVDFSLESEFGLADEH